MIVNGYCDEKFASVREEFERNFEQRGDIGASFAATIEGEFVVDIWGGHRNAGKSLAWEEDTIVNVFSSTKPFYFLAALMLADRGELAFEDKVTKYWPEYGQKGKEATEIRHLMSHSAGLPGFGVQLSLEQICDWEFVIGVLERQEPWWEPGTISHYHALTQGFLVGEVVRRITGDTLGAFLREEITGPLGADFHLGVDPQEFPRVAQMLVFPPSPDGTERKRPVAEVPEYLQSRIDGTPSCMPAETNSFLWRTAEVPGGNGHGNARSVARVSSLIANNGEVDGIRLISEAGVKRLFEPQAMMGDTLIGMGFGLNSEQWGGPEGAKACWWGGAGGSTNYADLKNRVSLSYVMNQMNYDIVGGPRGKALHKSFYDVLLTR
jgi:CubicO group peptidase (beta-lactamase class C family)